MSSPGDPCPDCSGRAYHLPTCPTRSLNMPTTPQPAGAGRHTAGPWMVRHDGQSAGIYAPSINGYDIARVHGYAERPGGGTMLLGPEYQANAALIAAAPDLLAALVALFPYAESRLEDMQDYQNAIESDPLGTLDHEESGKLLSVAVQALAAAREAIAKATGTP